NGGRICATPPPRTIAPSELSRPRREGGRRSRRGDRDSSGLAAPLHYTKDPPPRPREAATMLRTLLPFALAALACLSAGADDTPTIEELTFKSKDGSTHTVGAMKKRKKDVVKALTLAKNNTVWDKPKVIHEDELPSAVLPFDGWLYVAGRGTVLRYKQSKE